MKKIQMKQRVNKEMKKRILFYAACITVSAMLTACGGEQPAEVTSNAEPEAVTEEVSEEPVAEETDSAETENVEASVTEDAPAADEDTAASEDTGSTPADYKQLYMAEIEKLKDAGDADQFALVDVDGDEIPELAASSLEGSWDKDQEFLYTVADGELVLLASDIAPGMEGHYIAFHEGGNVVEQSGAAMGESHNYFEIRDGKLEPILSLFSYEDPQKDYEMSYLVDEKETDEDSFNKAAEEFISSHESMTKLLTEEMSVCTVSFKDGLWEYKEKDKIAYKSFEEIAKELE